MAVSQRAALGVLLPLLAAGVCAWLALFHVAPGIDLAAMARGIVGPATWPKAMLLLSATAAALLAISRLFEWLAIRAPSESAGSGDDYYEARSIGAILLLVAYGAALPMIGMAWATLLFLAGWTLLGGLGRPLLVAVTSIAGTVALLYFFVKLSKMPLDRGKGVFEQATVALYRLLGIY